MGPAKVTKRIWAVGPGVLLPVFAFGGAGRDFNPLRTHAYICFHRFGGKVKICTIEGCRFCMYKALRGARGFRTAYEHRSCLFESLLSCFWMYWNLFHRTFLGFPPLRVVVDAIFPDGERVGVFLCIYSLSLCILSLWCRCGSTGRCVAGADDRACGLFGRRIGTVPVRCHVQSRV